MHMHNVSYSAASAAAGRQGRTSPAGRERPHSAAASGGTRGPEPAALQPALQPGLFSLQSLQPALAHEIEEIDGRDLQPSALQRSALQPSAALQLSALQSSALQPVLQPGALQPPSLQPERGITRRSKAAARPATASASLRRSSSAVTVPRGSASAAVTVPRGSSAAGRAFKGGPSSGTPPPRRATHDTGGPHTHSYIHTRRTLTRAESAPPAAAAEATPSPGSAAELRGGSAAIRGGSAAIRGGSAAGSASREGAASRAARGFVISDDLELIRRREGLEPTKVVWRPYG